MAKDVLYIGIDLGTFRSVMVSSDSHEVEELTVIGCLLYTSDAADDA